MVSAPRATSSLKQWRAGAIKIAKDTPRRKSRAPRSQRRDGDESATRRRAANEPLPIEGEKIPPRRA
jgi:hypothetical protein